MRTSSASKSTSIITRSSPWATSTWGDGKQGLNVFNTKYVLARPDTATTATTSTSTVVIAHEYFHNWTGNESPAADWFQLSLRKAHVFRDQEFARTCTRGRSSGPRGARPARRAVFAEDAGRWRIPVRPASYMEINNFYTGTVYEKGAEVVA